MDKIPILHIRDSGGLFGAEQVILTLGKNIDLSKYSPMLLSIEHGDQKGIQFAQWCGKFNWRAFSIRVQKKIDFKAISIIRSFVKQHNIAVVHAHDFKSELYAVFGSFGTKAKRVVTSHGSTKDSLGLRITLLLSEYVLYPFFHKLIAVSNARYNSLVKNPVLKGKKIVLIENGIDNSLFEIISNQNKSAILNIPSDKKVIGIIGRLLPDKNHETLFKAFKQIYKELPNTIILVVGDGPNRDHLDKVCRSLGISEQVHFCGLRNDMVEVYNKIDVLVIPSLREGLPYVLLEAMMRNVPVIASNVGGIPDLICDKVTGFLIEPLDVKALSNALMKVLQMRINVSELVKRAFAIVNEKYSSASMVSKIEQVYDSVIK